MLKKAFIFFLLIALCTLASISICDATDSTVGIVLLHGKGGMPTNPAYTNLIKDLEGEGYIIITPEMPYSNYRGFDKSYEETASEIDKYVAELKRLGANRVFIMGHSLGANVAIYYATIRDVDGIVAMAPGHLPETSIFYENCGSSVGKAKEMVREGNGNKKSIFNDINQGRKSKIETTANIYLSWFNPEGPAVIPKNTAAIKPGTALLWVVGTRDKMYERGQKYAFDKAPLNTNNKYLVINSDHFNTPKNAAGDISKWIKNFEYNK